MARSGVTAPAAPEVVPPIPLRTGRIAEIELLRAIAVLMVIGQHIPGNLVFWPLRWQPVLLGGWTGVDLFFAISGFVIARALLPMIAPLRGWDAFLHAALEFWIRRAWRLLPSAWFWLAAPLVLCLVFNHSHAYGPFYANWEMAVAGVLDLANFRAAYIFLNHQSGTAFVQWSLSLEEQFYFALPFLAFLFRRMLWVPMAALAVAGFFAPVTPLAFETRLWPVAFGVLLAIWSLQPNYRVIEPTGLARTAIGRAAALWLPLLCLASLGNPNLLIVGRAIGPIALLSAGLVWLASFDGGYLCRDGALRRCAMTVGARSYSLYLVHIPVFFAAHEAWYRLHRLHVPGHAQAVLYVLLALAAVAVVAELNHRLLEMPLREYGKRLANGFATARRRSTVPQPA